MVGSLQGLHNTLIDWLEHWCCSTHLLRAGVASCGLSSFLRKISTFFWFVIRLLNCNIQALERSFVIHAFMLADLTTGMIFTCCTMQGYFDFPINSSFFFFFFSVLFESLRNNTETLLGALATMTVPAGNRVHFVRFCLIKQTGFLCIKYVLVFIPGKKPWQLLGLYSDMTSTPLSSHSSDTGSISFSSLGIGTNLK